jgi:hypothetical protein
MAKESTSGLGVYNVYGPRETGEGRSGTIRTAGVEKELELYFSHDTASLVSATIPAGSTISSVTADVVEAFTGATDLDVGTDGAETTNGADLAVTAGVAKGTLAGTWDNTVLASDTTVGVAITGTATAGKAKVVIKYSSI